jgi:hypothetical protein
MMGNQQLLFYFVRPFVNNEKRQAIWGICDYFNEGPSSGLPFKRSIVLTGMTRDFQALSGTHAGLEAEAGHD